MKKFEQTISIMKLGFRVTLFVGIIIGCSVLVKIYGPDTYEFQNGDWEGIHYTPDYNETEWSVLLDGHSHTTNSDGRLTPEQNIQWHLAYGFNAAVITDHNNIKGALQARAIARSQYNDSIKILIGLEWTTDRIHMNIIGMSDDFVDHFSSRDTFPIPPRNPSDAQIRDIIATTHSLGGIVVVNHYTRNSLDKPTREQLFTWGVDYFEIVNDDNYGKSVYDGSSEEFSRERGLGTITGSDMHDPTEMNVHGWTLMNTTEFTEESIFMELRSRSTDKLYNSTGVSDTASHQLNVWAVPFLPLKYVGKMFLGIIDFPAINLVDIMIFFGYIDGGVMMVGSVNVMDIRRRVHWILPVPTH